MTAGRRDAYEALLERCRGIPPVTTAVAYPCEATALAGAIEAAEAGLIEPILVGPAAKIREVAAHAALKIDPYPIEESLDPKSSAARAVRIVSS